MMIDFDENDTDNYTQAEIDAMLANLHAVPKEQLSDVQHNALSLPWKLDSTITLHIPVPMPMHLTTFTMWLQTIDQLLHRHFGDQVQNLRYGGQEQQTFMFDLLLPALPDSEYDHDDQ